MIRLFNGMARIYGFLWFAIWFCFCPSAYAQDLELDVEWSILSWNDYALRGDWQATNARAQNASAMGNESFCPTAFTPDQYLCVWSGTTLRPTEPFIIPEVPEDEQVTYRVESCVKGLETIVRLVTHDASGNETIHDETSFAGLTTQFGCQLPEGASVLEGYLPAGTQGVHVEYRVPSRGGVLYLLPVEIVYPECSLFANEPECLDPNGDDDGDGGSGDGDGGGSDDDLVFTGHEDLFNSAQGIADLLNNFDCGAPASITSAAGGLTGSGGGGLGAIISMILQVNLTQLQQIYEDVQRRCELQKGNALAEANLTALSAPSSTPAPVINPNAASTLSPELSDYVDAVRSEHVLGSDTVVTAANRTNSLLVSNLELQAVSIDRLLGGQREAYETEDGPRIGANEVSIDPNLEFEENSYLGNYEKLKGLAREIEPDYLDRTVLGDAGDVEPLDDNCFTGNIGQDAGNIEVNERWDGVRNSAVNALSGSELGMALCTLLDRPDLNVVDVCFGDGSAFVIDAGVGDAVLIERLEMCVYGPDAPQFMNSLFDALPALFMFMSAFGVVRMFV